MNSLYSDHQLYFKLLGTPQIFSHGEEISITRRNVRALAYYLACQPGLVNREELKLLFWPEQPESKASSALRETLSKLRGTLPEREMLISTATHVYFDMNIVQVDVREFLDIYTSLESSLANLPRDNHPAQTCCQLDHRSSQSVGGVLFPQCSKTPQF